MSKPEKNPKAKPAQTTGAPSSSRPPLSMIPDPLPSLPPSDSPTFQNVLQILALHSPRTAGQKGASILPEFGIIDPVHYFGTVEEIGRLMLATLYTAGGELKPPYVQIIHVLSTTTPLASQPDLLAVIVFRLAALTILLGKSNGPAKS